MNGRIVRAKQGFQLPEVGKVKIGEKAISSKTGKEYPKALDYFIGYGKYKSSFDNAFGEKPQTIQIIFISDDPSYSCNEYYELRNSKGDVFGKGDGENFQIWNKDKKQYVECSIKKIPSLMYDAEQKCNDNVDAKNQTKWKVKLTLRFLIVKIPNILGHWSLLTGGEASSIKQIRDTFDFVQNRAGTVTRILFDLNVSKHNSQKPDDPSSYPVLSLIPNMSDENLLLLGKVREQIRFNEINYLTNENLLQLTQNQKQIPEKIEVVSGEVIEVTENKLFNY